MTASWVRSPRQSCVTRKRGRGAQIEAPARSLLPQEVGFHLDVAIAEHQDIDAAVQALSISECVRCFN